MTAGPGIPLLDEPFAALARSLRLDMRIDIKRLQRSRGLTAILVTHDQDKAMSVADRIAAMRQGSIELLGSSVAVYDTSEAPVFAGFIGTAHWLAATGAAASAGGLTVRLNAAADVTLDDHAMAPGARVLFSVRPEHLMRADGPDVGSFPCPSASPCHPAGGPSVTRPRRTAPC